MPSFPPLISPWLAAFSSITFACLFVGSLFVFPLKSKQQRQHAKYTALAHSSYPIPHSASSSSLTPLSSPRPSESSSHTALSSITFTSKAMNNHNTNNNNNNNNSNGGIQGVGSTSTGSINITTLANTTATNASAFSSSTSGAASPSLSSTSSPSPLPTASSLGSLPSQGFTFPPASASSSPLPGVLSKEQNRKSFRHSTHFVDITTTTTTTSSTTTTTSFNSAAVSPASAAISTSEIRASHRSSTHLIDTLAAVPSTTARAEVVNHGHYLSQSEMGRHSSFPPIPSLNENQKLDRDHPLVIMQRFKGILLTCCVVPFYLWWVFKFSGAIPSDQSFWSRLGHFLRLLGISIPNHILKLFNHVVIPLFLVAVLFMGPLIMMFLSNELPFQQAFNWAAQRQHMRRLIGLRNFVVGPISEEFIFRSCMVSICAHSGASPYAMVFGLPFVFGVAHLNHAYESYVKNGRTSRALLNAGTMALLQLTYTTLFGWLATFLFLRTSNLLAPILCHAFCNMMGLPDVTNIQYYGRWKNALYLAFVLGVVFFGILLRPLTNPGWYGNEESSAYWLLMVGATPAVEDK